MEKVNQTQTWVSFFKGFSKPVGNVTLAEVLTDVAGEKYLAVIARLRTLIAQGQTDAAARVKRQLPGFTLSALYQDRRTAEGLTHYNDLLILDFDKLDEDRLHHCRRQIIGRPETLFCFRSPSGTGLKAGVHYRSPEADCLRQALLKRKQVSVAEVETYHKRVFELCRKEYEEHCQTPVDSSGSDIGRLCFLSYDPEVYINPEMAKHHDLNPMRELRIAPCTAAPTSPTPEGSGRKPKESPDEDGAIDPQIRMEFQRCVSSVNRSMKYEHGQRDTYLYTLGNKCYTRHIPGDMAIRLAQQQYGGDTDIDIPRIIANAYRYTGKTDQRKQEQSKPLGIRVMELLESMYEARRNVVLENLEFRPISAADAPKPPFRSIRKEDYNNMYLDVLAAGINCQPRLIHTVVNSRFARNYNPFEEYFYNLPPWDGQTDHIHQLAETLQTNNQAFWRDCFKRWLVGVVACALDDDHENQLALIIKGGQGKGKSTWIRHLLPPQLKTYYRNGIPKAANRDHMLLLSQRLLINLEEFEGMKSVDIAELKRLITQDAVTERKAYGEEANLYIRRASFIASTNESRFLEDISGTRRFPTVTAEHIDYTTPVNHAGIYSQTLHLWKSGFRYWYGEEEFQAFGAHNKQYVIASQEQELLHLYFRSPLPTDYPSKWMSVSAILAFLNIWGKLLPTKASQRALINILEKEGFRKRETGNGITEYEVFLLNPNASLS